MKPFLTVAALPLAVALMTAPADAKGCIKGDTWSAASLAMPHTMAFWAQSPAVSLGAIWRTSMSARSSCKRAPMVRLRQAGSSDRNEKCKEKPACPILIAGPYLCWALPQSCRRLAPWRRSPIQRVRSISLSDSPRARRPISSRASSPRPPIRCWASEWWSRISRAQDRA
jgi:hypothetical protein